MVLENTKYKLLLVTAIALALSYLLIPFVEGSFLNIAQKASACVMLAALAFSAIKQSYARKFLTLALLCSALGDIFLAIRSDDYFVQGLGSFLIAHLVYISIFARAQNFSKPDRIRLLISAAIVLFSVIMMYILWPVLGELKAPVFLYITVISAMAIMALFSSYPALFICIGAFSFLISDATIAINKFLVPFASSGPVIWITYILAQVLLTIAIIEGENKKNTGI